MRRSVAMLRCGGAGRAFLAHGLGRMRNGGGRGVAEEVLSEARRENYDNTLLVQCGGRRPVCQRRRCVCGLPDRRNRLAGLRKNRKSFARPRGNILTWREMRGHRQQQTVGVVALMRVGLLKAAAAIGASAPLLVLLMLSLVEAAPDASGDPGRQEPPAVAPAAGTLAPAVADWLEQAAATYQTDVAGKLSVPRHAEASDAFATLRAAVEGALAYVRYWIERAYETAGLPPPAFSQASVALLTDRTARDARAFIEARRKAEADWREAVERADAARRTDEPGEGSSGDSAAEAERKRAEARKEELRKLKEDLDRRIEEGLRKLEELEKLDKTRKTEATRRGLAADAARSAEEALKAMADQARRLAGERRAAEQGRPAAARAGDERKAADAEAARKAEAERKAAEDRRLAEARAAEVKAAEERRRAAAQTEAARRAADAEAVRKAEAERKAAEEKRLAEARAAEAKAAEERRLTAAEAEAARKAAEEKRLAEARAAEVKAAGERRLAAAEAEAARKSAKADATRRAEAERKAAEEKRLAEAALEEPRKAAETAQARKGETERETAGEQRQIEPGSADERRAVAATAPDAVGATPEARKKSSEAAAGGAVATAAGRPSAERPRAKRISDAAPRASASHKQRKQARAKRTHAKADVRAWRRQAARPHCKPRRAVRTRSKRARHVHVVKPGETLWSISRRHLGNGAHYTKVHRANRKQIRNPHRIYPGQVLRLPARQRR